MTAEEVRNYLVKGEELLWDEKEKEYYDYIMARWPELLAYTQAELAKGNVEPDGFENIFLLNFVGDLERIAYRILPPDEFIKRANELITITVNDSNKTSTEADIAQSIANLGKYRESCQYIDEKLAEKSEAANLINAAMSIAADNKDKDRAVELIEEYIGCGEKLKREDMWLLDNVYKIYMDFGEAEKAEAIKNFVRSYAASTRKHIEVERIGEAGQTYKNETPKVGRNDPCPCGSGKKYKKCCGCN